MSSTKPDHLASDVLSSAFVPETFDLVDGQLPPVTLARPPRRSRGYKSIRRFYRRYLQTRLALSPLARQRLKLLWYVGGYRALLRLRALSLPQRLWLIWRCIRVDWFVPHAHEPLDCAWTLVALGERRARPGEVMIEAGCWQGGSTAKWSLACRLLGYRLHVYDSFQGVESRTSIEGRYDFTGEYAAAIDTVRNHVKTYGDIDVCTFHPGWFRDTFAAGTVPHPVRLAYIDCDLVKGTNEVLTGVAPVLSEDAAIASQDGQIPVVAEFLATAGTWRALGIPPVHATRYSQHLLVFRLGAIRG